MQLRVAFGQAYHLKFDRKLWESMQPYPPLGALYAATVAQNAQCQVSFYDSMLATSMDTWADFVQQEEPDLVVLQEDNFNYLSKMCLARMRTAAVEMIGIAKQAGAMVIVGGADVTDDPEHYLRAGADFAMLGEGEHTLAEIIDLLQSGQVELIPQIQNVASLERHQGDVILRDRRPVIRDPDRLGLPAWDLVDLERYRSIWLERHGYFSINMVTTRGCPYSCNWCAKPIWGRGYKSRSPEDVVDEMAYLHERIAPDHIWFMDDIFGLNPRWLSRFAELTRQRDLRIPYKCLSRADLLLRPNEVEHLADSGCTVVWMGAESGSQKILDAMDKGTQVQQIVDARGLLKTHGIETGFFIQFGYPGEGMREIRDTFGLIRKTLPDDMGISVAYPLPGTKFHEKVKDQISDQTNWEDSDDLAMLFDGPFPTPFYRWLHRTTHAHLRFHTILGDGRRSFRDNARLVYHGMRWMALRASLSALAFFFNARRGLRPQPS